MGKFRKKLKKNINPAKTNKLIVAVGVGVLIVFSVLFFLTIGPQTPGNKAAAMKNALEYLEKSDGILAVKTFPDQNRALIICDTSQKKRDFVKIARFAALKLSNKMGDQEATLELAEDKEKQVVHRFFVQGGRLLRETTVSNQ
jgi:hypothetical protein